MWEQWIVHGRPFFAMLQQKEKIMSRLILLVVLLAALIISGCSFSKPETLKSSLPALEDEWTISMTHSGGIIGLSRSIEILSDGEYTVVDERENKSVTGNLKKDDLSKI